jgi:hypothetical protein
MRLELMPLRAAFLAMKLDRMRARLQDEELP